MTYERELERTVERLRQLSDSRLSSHEEQFAALLGNLTDRPVPRLQPWGWADQLLVIGREVPDEDQGAAGAQLIEFRRTFDLTVGP